MMMTSVKLSLLVIFLVVGSPMIYFTKGGPTDDDTNVAQNEVDNILNHSKVVENLKQSENQTWGEMEPNSKTDNGKKTARDRLDGESSIDEVEITHAERQMMRKNKKSRRKRDTICYTDDQRSAFVTPKGMSLSKKFLDDLYAQKVDLIILIERSRPMGRYDFNFNVRKILGQFLRHNIVAGPDHVRLAIVSFALDKKVHFDGISEDFYKCDLWERKSYFDDIILYPTDDSWFYADLVTAYDVAFDIFNRGGKTDNPRYVLLFTSGELYIENRGGFEPSLQALNNQINATILGVLSGRPAENLINARSFVGGIDNLIGNECEFLKSLYTRTPITKERPLLVPFPIVNKQFCYCDIVSGYSVCGLDDCGSCGGPGTGGIPLYAPPDEPNECQLHTCTTQCTTPDDKYANHFVVCNEPLFQSDCSDRAGAYDPYTRLNDNRVCRCRWRSGYTGPECTKEIDPCVPNACANGGTCIPGQKNNNSNPLGWYICLCPSNYTHTFCEVFDKDNHKHASGGRPGTNATAIIAGSAAGGGLLLIIGIVIGCCLCKKRRRRDVATGEMATYTNPNHLQLALEYNDVVHEDDLRQEPGRPPSILLGMRDSIIRRAGWPRQKAPLPPPKPKVPPILPSRMDRRQMNTYWEAELPEEVINRLGAQEEGVVGPTVIEPDDEPDELYVNQMPPTCKDMDEWSRYIGDMISSSVFADLCIVNKNRRKYISSSMWILPTKGEIRSIQKAFRSLSLNSDIKLKNKPFSVVKNDGTLIKCIERGELAVLCLAKSKYYIVIGFSKSLDRDTQCVEDVKYLRDYLIGLQL